MNDPLITSEMMVSRRLRCIHIPRRLRLLSKGHRLARSVARGRSLSETEGRPLGEECARPAFRATSACWALCVA